jgi:hypothetical protein
VVGRTVLRTFQDDNGRRFYPCTKQYKVNLFGVPLELTSLAFQEQDTVLGACATVALWSAFQKVADLFGTPAPTPSVITRAASEIVHYGRPIPSHGLNVLEICSAIRHVGLEPEVVDVTDEVPLVSVLYAYLRMGLPVILGVLVEGRGLHAITLIGYSLRERPINKSEIPANKQFIPMLGLRIDKLYGHDDQVGPFSRLKVVTASSVKGTTIPGHFEGSWTDNSSGQILSLHPRVAIVPVYHKIRLTFPDVQKWLTRLHVVLQLVVPPQASVEWDVHLALSNDYKKDVRLDDELPATVRENLLLSLHPRFVWRGSFRLNGREALELLFDATGLARSFPLYAVVWRMEDFAAEFQRRLENAQLSQLLTDVLTPPFIDFLKKTLKHRDRPMGFPVD